MAAVTAAAASSTLILLPCSIKLCSCPTNGIKSLHHFHPLRTSLIRNPISTTNCHGKLHGVSGEALDDAGEFYSVDEDEEEEEDDESSLDLLFRFLQNMFRKFSKQARKATASVLPPGISIQLITFAVDGVLLLALLSIAKALLEVVCTLGGTVFIAILLLRLTWVAISYFQSSGNSIDQGRSYGASQPAT